MNARILIVEDEEPLTMLLRYNLEAEGYEVETAARGDEADTRLKESSPDLVVLDWMLPGLSGIELCRRLRARPETRQLPIIMLTARGEESEKVRGLATGADDYIVKPFSVPELLARVRALLRRANPERVALVLNIGDIELDREKKRVSRNGRAVDLGPTEYRLLEFLMERPGRVFSREQLLDGVWGSDIYIDERTVDVHVGRLRKAINRGHMADPIRTVRGAGYALDDRFGERRERPGTQRRARRGRIEHEDLAPLRAASGVPNGRPLVAPAVAHWLVGDARVIGAIRRLVRVFAAAEEEFRAAGIADRPAAGLFGQLQQSLALLDRNFDQFRLGLGLVFIGERGIAPHRGARHPHHARGTRLARPWRGRGGALGAAGQAEAVHFADHRITGDAAEFGRDLAGGQAVRP